MRRVLVIALLVAACCLLATSFSLAHEEARSGYHIQHYTDENGLPQNSVKAIMKDRNGFVWLSTEAGLVRFDGHRFLIFTRSLIPISSNRFAGFFPSLSKYDSGNLYEFYAQTDTENYVGILSNGLTALDTSFFDRNLNFGPGKLPSPQTNVILPSLPSLYGVDPFYQPYLISSGSKKYYKWQGNKVSFYSQGSKIYQVDGSFKDFFLVGQSPYATTKDGGFVKIHSRSGTVSPGGDILRNPAFAKEQKLARLFWNNGSQRAFLYLNKCFYSLQESKHGVLTTKLLLEDFDFDTNAIGSAYYDEGSGYLFLGSPTKGLFVIKRKDFQTLKSNTREADNVFYSQMPLADNAILAAQGYKIRRDSGSVNTSDESVLMSAIKYKFSLSMNSDSSFWMGSGNDLYKFNKTGKALLKHWVLKEKFKSLYVDEQDKLWIGGLNGTLFRLSPTDTLPELIVRGSFGGTLVMHRETPDQFLLATTKGLFRVYTGSKRVEEIRNFRNITIRSFYTNPDGTWITTYGNGLYLWTKNRIVNFPLDKYQFLATAHCIVEDAKGYFWITTNKGLFQVAKKQLLEHTENNRYPIYYLYYDKSHGFETNEFNGGCSPCAVRLPNGVVSLPSMDGLVWFSPNEIRSELPDRGIFISAIEVDGKPVAPKDNLEISRDFEQLRLHVATPYFGHVNNIQMSYSLTANGEAPKWFALDDFVIPLSKISSGKYELVIRKVNGFGVNDYTYKKISLSIPPAWYETWWFWCVLVLLIQAVILLVVRLRTRYLIDKEREDNLRRHYRVISQIVAAVNHDIQTPLHYVTYSLQQINSHLHKQSNSNQLITRMSDEALNTTLRIGSLTKNLLDYIKLQNKNASARTEMSSIHVFQLVTNTCKLFSAIAGNKDISIRNEVEPDFEVFSDHNLLSIVIHNFLDNALKISKSNINISSSFLNGRKQIVMADDGGGMPESLLNWLNKSYRSYEEWLRLSAYPEQKGIGLVIVKDLCVLLNIELIVTVTAGKGTVIQLVFNETGVRR